MLLESAYNDEGWELRTLANRLYKSDTKRTCLENCGTCGTPIALNFFDELVMHQNQTLADNRRERISEHDWMS